MRELRPRSLVLVTLFTLMLGSSCSGPVWREQCGPPLCGPDDGGVPEASAACQNAKNGEACDPEGLSCPPLGSCGGAIVCGGPEVNVNDCPKSRARYKRGIHYLSVAERARVRDELLAMRLSTWRYLSESDTAREHLGFIIDDAPDSPGVASGGERVDLYGYTSMAVAAIQEQQRQIDALLAEVKALREELNTEKRGR